MNIQNLRYFAIAAKLENVSRTAQLMHTSQSAVSKNIQALEEELGVRLFDRSGKKLILNDAGRRFAQSSERVLEEMDLAVKDLKNMSVEGDSIIRICAMSMDARLFTCMSMFRLAYPETEYRLDTFSDRFELPDINEYDLVIYPDELRFRKFRGYDFYSEKYLFAVRADSPLAGRVSVPVRMMDGLPFVFLRYKLEYEYPFHVCLAQNVRMEHISCVDSRDHHLQFIVNGIGAGFVPEGNVGIYRNDKRIKLLYLTDDRFARAVKVCFKREKHLSKIAGAFKEYFLGYFNLQNESSQNSDPSENR